MCSCAACAVADVFSSAPLTAIRPYSERHCTDVFFLLLFLACWAVVGYITQQAITRGDPSRLSFTHGTDMNGSVCGVSPSVADKPYAAFPFPTHPQFMICVTNCSAALNDSDMALPVPSTPLLFYCMPNPQAVLNISQLNLTTYDANNAYLQSATTQALASIGDLVTIYPVIIASAAITIALSFTWLIVLQLAAGALIWTLLLAVLFGGALAGYALLQYAKDEADDPTLTTQQVHIMQYTAYVLLALTAVFALIILALRKRIKLAVQVVKEASRALSGMRSMLFFPLLPIAAFILFTAAWLVVALYMYSVGSYAYVATPNQVLFDFYTEQRNGNPEYSRQFVWDSQFQRYFALHTFLFLWTTEFLVYLTFTTLAGAVSDWYFTPKTKHQMEAIQTMEQARALAAQAAAHTVTHTIQVKSHDAAAAAPIKVSSHRPSRFPILAALVRTLRFHIGTVLAAALIIAIVQFVRLVVTYIQAQSKGRNSRVQKAVFACVQCCLACLQSFLDKVNRNALIWCAIWGDALLPSMRGSFQLIWNNLFRVAAINLVANFLFFLGKAVIAAATTGLCLIILCKADAYAGKVHSLFVPCGVIFILAYLVASLFMTVFSTTVDTVFLCFLVDCQENEKDGLMLASDGLRQLVQDHAQQSMTEAKFANEKQLYTQSQVAMAPLGQPHS